MTLPWRLAGFDDALYAVEFSNGITKIGRTSMPQSRVQQLRQAAGRVSVRVTRIHFTAPLGHMVACAREVELRKRLSRIGNTCRAKREFFSHVSFEVVRQLCDQMADPMHRRLRFLEIDSSPSADGALCPRGAVLAAAATFFI